jgi:protein-L-isoaspartate(D-aspartate) O-methyltransferase
MIPEKCLTIKNNNSERLGFCRLWAELLLLVLVLCVDFAGVFSAAWADDSDTFVKKRREMVDRQIKVRNIVDVEVLSAMSTVPRHLFVPDYLRRQAYVDGPLPIGHGQTISQPYIVAFMTEMLHIKQHDKVLEIGTGSGYQAAILAELTDQVYTMEIIPELADTAGKRLKNASYTSVSARQGDGYYGWPEAAPFDAIVVTAAAEFIPPPLLKQLKEGGRMIIPVGSPFYVQHLILVEKSQGKITTKSLMPVRFVPFRRSQ